MVFHFVLAGIFTYIYARNIGACVYGATLSVVLFCFGSAYAGCMINTASLKTLAYFPLSLYFLERYFETRKFIFLIVNGFVLGIAFLAGATQIAFYFAVICIVYFFVGVMLSRGITLKDMFFIVVSYAIAGGIFYPQFVLTKTLASLSYRSQATLDFSLSDSFLPVNLASLVFPYAVSQGARFYVGVLSLLFVLTALIKFKSERQIKMVVIIGALSLFISFGKYNPVYVAIVKFFELYNFRGNSKAVLFGVFSLAVLTGYGVTIFFNYAEERLRKKIVNLYSIIVGLSIAVFLGVSFLIKILEKEIIAWGKLYVTNYIYGKSFHRDSLESYFARVETFYHNILENTSCLNPFILSSIVLCSVSVFIALLFYKKEKIRGIYKYLVFAVVFVDLVVFSIYGTGFRGNIKSFDFLKPDNPKILNFIREDKDIFRVLPYNLATGKLPNWIKPSLNVIYGVDSAALYTPLANEYYRKALSDLEVVDNALGLKPPADGSLEKNLELIRILNVKYIVSSKFFSKDFLEIIFEENGIYLYKIKDYFPRFFIAQGDAKLNQAAIAPVNNIIKYDSGVFIAEVFMDFDGYLFFSENNYPGWKVYIDGKPSVIEPFMLIQKVFLFKGRHIVKFIYSPFRLAVNKVHNDSNY
ncbi:conserved hypothetical protein, membrane [Candidatus Omnitrophus magneticus]|uniref:Uncharacterized protein n=1 Tax=Candidatus Omnitrophus magneticus TaxID=1609969 RepID=A0A0F0CSW9_9BACT|nr:conserved hypothetical protein, membrane [Candidatus Omnitrophus magneticus]